MNNDLKVRCMVRAIEICCDYVLRRFNNKILPRDFEAICLELSKVTLIECVPDGIIIDWACEIVYAVLEMLKVEKMNKTYDGHEEDRESLIRCFRRMQDDLMEWKKTVDLEVIKQSCLMEVNDHE